MKAPLLSLICSFFITSLVSGQTTIISQGSVWKYLDNGSSQSTSWRSVTFNDATWKSGAAQLGYGDGDEATVVSYGTNASKKYITTYFRKVVSISNPSGYNNFTLNIKRDDGAVVYINGTERFRSNMPTGSISANTKASTAAADDGNTWQTVTLASTVFANGNNAICVEIHQFSTSDPDISFDLQLFANPNLPPIANAGTDKTITLPVNSTSLTGIGTDPDGTIASYAWSQISGPSSSVISSPASATTNVSSLIQGTYCYKLTVTDNKGAIASDTVKIFVNAAINQPPVANAGTDQSITLPVSSVSLSGSGSSDPDGTISAYLWTQVSGPSVAVLSTPASVSTTASGLIQGSYTFRLTVTDNNGATASDDVVITVNAAINQPPVANAGTDQSITIPVSSVSLSGSGSSDSDGTISAYLWTQVSGPSVAVLSTPASVSTTASGLIQGSYTFRLTVTDNNGATAYDDIVITVNAAINQPPVANAGTDQSITLPISSVSLSGSGSSDSDGTISAYLWAQVSGPSVAVLSTPASVSTTASGLIQGSYTFRLTVTDNNGATASDDVIITVNPITTLTAVSFGSVWKYLDNGSNQDTAWRKSGFNDASWASGPAQLGYGDGDEATVVSYGADVNNKYITTYFRKNVDIVSPASYANFTLNVKRDDGIIVYVNGTEAYRNNMPTGTVLYSTLASTAAADDGSSIFTATLSSSYFVNGTNTIAVEIHQSAGNSSDISFDLELKGNPPGLVNLTRGPYLQMGNETAVTIRWRTDAATDSKFEAGTSIGNYTLSAYNTTQTTEHEVRLTGLASNTKYYYRFGSSTQSLQSAADNFFRTAPSSANTEKVRIAVFGDCGRNDNSYQTATLSAYQTYTAANPAPIMLLLGDNAYNAGTDAEYTSNFFNVYSGNILKNHVLFPAPGNHDYANTAARQTDHNVPYYSNFTMPTAGECGGVASGTEAFYSYNWGNIHFLSLDSYGYEAGSTRLYDTLGPQVTWIKNDLNANSKKWTIAYWHHPPYTMGSHNSDTETELINMRQNFIRILERYGVDLILCGHSHDYERSYLLKGYYGNEASFNAATHAVSSSSALYDGSANSCPYSTVSGPVNHGTVYVVSGSAGASGGVQAGYPHNALPFAQNDGGMLYLEVEDNRLDAKFIRKDGVIADKFTIMKDVSKTNNYSIAAGQSIILTASWIGNYNWSTGATTRSITVSPGSTTNYSCNDGSTSCVTDNFTVTVTAPKPAATAGSGKFSVYPVPVNHGNALMIETGSFTPAEITILDEKGMIIRKMIITNSGELNTSDLNPGIYFIRSLINGRQETRKVVVR